MTDNVTPLPSGRPSVELCKDGTVRFTVGGQRYTLRRPKTFEFRRLREQLAALNDDIRADAEQLAVEAERINGEVEALLLAAGGFDADTPLRDLPVDMRAKVREIRVESDRLAQEFRDRQEDRRNRWFADAVATLGNGKSPDLLEDDNRPGLDAEPWMGDAEFITALLRHWQTVPLARGG